MRGCPTGFMDVEFRSQLEAEMKAATSQAASDQSMWAEGAADLLKAQQTPPAEHAP